MINLSLIGMGYWGKKLQRYIEESKEFNLRYTFDSKSTLKWDVDAVVIATPNETHYSLAKTALLNGKHVLVEKPLAMSFKECLELRKLAKGRVLMTDYSYPFSESLQKAKLLVSHIKSIDITLKRTDRFVNRDAYLVLGSHALSILNMFIPLASLQFQRTANGKIDFRNKDLTGRISVDLNGNKETKVVIYGQNRKITCNFNENHTLRHVLNHFARAIKGEVKDNLPMSLDISKILEEL